MIILPDGKDIVDIVAENQDQKKRYNYIPRKSQALSHKNLGDKAYQGEDLITTQSRNKEIRKLANKIK